MILDDFVFLGTTVPEQMSDGRVVRCSAGYSHDRRSLVRVYPISPFGSVKRWQRYRIALEQNPKDNRVESYKLAGDRTDPDGLTRQLVDGGLLGTVDKGDRLHDIDRYLVPSIRWMNDRRLSLGIVEPEAIETRFEYDQHADPDAPRFPGMEEPHPEWGRKSYALRPRLRFSDEDGHHDLGLNEHGCFEWLRKGHDPHQLWHNLRIGDRSRDVRLLVGNLCNQRNAWVVISYLSFPKAAPSLFDLPTEEVSQ